MITFSKYSDVCRYDDGLVEQMTLSDLQTAFEIAELVLSTRDCEEWINIMWTTINRVRSGLPKSKLQSLLYNLEQRKVDLLKKYYEKYDESILQEHNEVELDIRDLSGQHELIRFTRPNMLRGLKIDGKNDK